MQATANPETPVRTQPIETPAGESSLPILGLCAAAFLLAWLPRLHWGFWTDETGTFWMVSKGWLEAIARTESWPGQSILYSILESFFVSSGFWKEPLLRLPSLLAIGIAAWQLKRTAELMIGRGAGWLTLVPFLCAPEIIRFGTSARPYALALAASIASFRYLIEWQQSPNQKAAAKYLISSVLIVHFQYLFGFVFFVQALFLVCCRLAGRGVSLGLPLATSILLPISLLPLLRILRFSAQQSQGFDGAAPPPVIQLLQACFPPVELIGMALGAVLLLVSARNFKWRRTPLRPEFVFLLAAWTILGPLAFFLAARLTGHSVFASRYFLFALPGFVLAAVWAISGLERKDWRFLILLAMFAATVLHPANLLVIFRDFAMSWREPLSLIASQSGAERPTVFVASGIVESTRLNWAETDPSTSRLFAPLTAYPIPNPAIPLPYHFSDQVKDFLRARGLAGYRKGERCFLLAASDSDLGPWMSSYMEQLGFHAESHPMGDFVVIQFRRD